METIDKAKEVVSSFLKVEPASVSEATIIDNNALHSSVLVHRMYAMLRKEGIDIHNPQKIKTFGELMEALNSGGTGKVKADEKEAESSVNNNMKGSDAGLFVGIDIEEVQNMPRTDDYRGDEFYSNNFSAKEISYCILQSEPRRSFAGKFAAKEAVIKADNSFKEMPFKSIEILNDSNGRPVFGGFAISISHTDNHAIAAVVKGGGGGAGPTDSVSTDEIKTLMEGRLSKMAATNDLLKKVSIIAILISIAAVCFAAFAIVR